MNTDGRHESNPPSLSKFHGLLRQMAISKGMAIPETDEEFALLEKSVGASPLPEHDFSAVLELIETGELPQSKVVEFPAVDQNVIEELAQAARNGKEIPAEIKKMMEMDRAAAERDRLSK